MSERKHKMEHVKQLRTRFLEGENVEVLAKELGVSVSRMHSIWTSYGFTASMPKKRQHRIPVTTLLQIHSDWCKGQPLSVFARRLDIPPSSLRNILLSAGLDLTRPNGIPSNGGYRGSATLKQRNRWMTEAHKMRSNGVKWVEIHETLKSQDYEGTKEALARMYRRWLIRINDAKSQIPTHQ